MGHYHAWCGPSSSASSLTSGFCFYKRLWTSYLIFSCLMFLIWKKKRYFVSRTIVKIFFKKGGRGQGGMPPDSWVCRGPIQAGAANPDLNQRWPQLSQAGTWDSNTGPQWNYSQAPTPRHLAGVDRKQPNTPTRAL